MSKSMKRAYEIAQKYDEGLKATDRRFNFCVRIIHEEGTYLWFESAFLMMWGDPQTIYDPTNDSKYQGTWLLAFTEHQGFHVFAPDDLCGWGQYEQSHKDILFINKLEKS